MWFIKYIFQQRQHSSPNRGNVQLHPPSQDIQLTFQPPYKTLIYYIHVIFQSANPNPHRRREHSILYSERHVDRAPGASRVSNRGKMEIYKAVITKHERHTDTPSLKARDLMSAFWWMSPVTSNTTVNSTHHNQEMASPASALWETKDYL